MGVGVAAAAADTYYGSERATQVVFRVHVPAELSPPNALLEPTRHGIPPLLVAKDVSKQLFGQRGK